MSPPSSSSSSPPPRPRRPLSQSRTSLHRALPAVAVPEAEVEAESRERRQLSDYVEAKVREMMAKEGVVLDFSDTKLKGRIVTKTKIIKEVVGRGLLLMYRN